MTAPDWLPDWRDASQYPDKRNTSSARWGWEFLRRNPKYNTFYDEYVRPFVGEGTIDNDAAIRYEKRKKRGAAKVAANKDKTITVYGPHGLTQSKFGVLSAVAPEDDYTPIFPHQKARVIPATGDYSQESIAIFKDELFVYFRLDVPLKWQLRRAEKLLLSRFKAYPQTDERYRPFSYQNYLRMLDAKAHKVPNAEIARIIYNCTKDSNGYSSALQKVQAGLERAKLLRDKHYCRVALGNVK